ncbi:unnamed protein product [Chrysoparadoxa australica]
MAGTSETMNACLSLMRRLPPDDTDTSLAGLTSLVAPEVTDELLQRVDQPLQEATDPETGRAYLLCEYNRDADSYRSPWSNKYDPPLEDGYLPRDVLRLLELDANELLDAYRELYYEGGVSSVYLWDLEEGESEGTQGGFAGCFLIRKIQGGMSWESIHVVQVVPEESPSKRCSYKLNTTLLLSIDSSEAGDGNRTMLSGNMTQSKEQISSYSSEDDHLVTLGGMIEDMEIAIRRDIDGLHIQKTRQILNSVRSDRGSGGGATQSSTFTDQLNAAIMGHGAKKEQPGGLAEKFAAMQANSGS